MSTIQVKKLQTLTGHRDSIYTVQSSGVSDIFFSAAGDGMVVQWNFNSPEEGQQIAQLPNSIYALNFYEESDLLIAGHNYEGIHLLDWRNKKEAGSLKLGSAPIFDIQSRPRECYVASGDGIVTMIDIETLSVKKQISASGKSARTMAINPTTNEIAVGYSDNYIRVFDLDDLSLKREWEAHKNSVFTLSYSPDFRFLLSGSRDAHLKSWAVDADYNLNKDVIAHLYAINNLVFSPNGKHLLTCSLDKSIKVWQAADLTLLKVIDKARHAGHGTSINKLLWSSFKDQLVSASDDRTLSIWDVIF